MVFDESKLYKNRENKIKKYFEVTHEEHSPNLLTHEDTRSSESYIPKYFRK